MMGGDSFIHILLGGFIALRSDQIYLAEPKRYLR